MLSKRYQEYFTALCNTMGRLYNAVITGHREFGKESGGTLHYIRARKPRYIMLAKKTFTKKLKTSDHE